MIRGAFIFVTGLAGGLAAGIGLGLTAMVIAEESDRTDEIRRENAKLKQQLDAIYNQKEPTT
jgi:hypothetical protein